MRSPAVPLSWEIWRRGRGWVGAIAVASVLSWVIDFAQRGEPPGPTPSFHNQLFGLLSFVILLGTLSYLEPADDRGMGRFPRRLFTLPVSTLVLVAVPVTAGIVGIELLYLLWKGRLSGPEPGSQLFVAVLLGAFMVFYHAVLWTLERLGPLRLVVLGGVGVAFFWIGSLPSRSQPMVGAVVAGLALVQFFLVWRYVVRIRSGAEGGGPRLGLLLGEVANALPRRRDGFQSATSAGFWYEWRCAGSGYPALVAGALLLLLGPVSILIREDPADTGRFLLAALALPLVVAMPAGLAFSKPMFWSEEMALPSFVGVRPLPDAELIAIKLRVAAVATVIAWLVVLGFLGAWLAFWANTAGTRELLDQLRSLNADWWVGIVALGLLCAMLVSWRFMVAGLWAGMSGSRTLFNSSLAPIGLVIIAAAILDVGSLPGWIGADIGRLAPFLWGGALVVGAKLWLAARGFRRTSSSWARHYLAIWLAGVACLAGLGEVILRGAGRSIPSGDVPLVRTAIILLAVMVLPLARPAWAPWFLGRNRHRR